MARRIAAHKKIPYFNLEDGFIRSVGLGVQGAASFSLVIDDLGIYYDASKPSRLEKILSDYDFAGDNELEEKAEQAINLIKRFKISKYNAAFDESAACIKDSNQKKILVIAQTAGDMSLKYGHGNRFSTTQVLEAAFKENPGAEVYLKIHPDVIAGKKESDLDIEKVPSTCWILTQNINPISLLEKIDKVYTKTSQMGFEALLLGKECVCFGMPFYAGWGLTDDRVTCGRRNRKLTANKLFAGAYILYSRYYNPYQDQETDIIDTLHTIKKYRDIELINGENPLLFGFASRYRNHYPHFFSSLQQIGLTFCSTTKEINDLSNYKPSSLFIWGKSENRELKEIARENALDSYSVEIGPLQVALGADMHLPCSLVVDSKGAYNDPTRESDLEYLLSTYDFKSHAGLLERAKKIIAAIVQDKLVNHQENSLERPRIEGHGYDKIILITGQAEDDDTVDQGGLSMTNSSLLELVRKNNPASYIMYKPPPDAVSDRRKGQLPESYVRKYCNRIVADPTIEACICDVDEVHTISSLSGFTALLFDKKVMTYGLPFYANWGLTEDLLHCPRRTRLLSREELVAGTLLLYPRYIHPVTRKLCEIEPVLKELRRRKWQEGRPSSHRQIKIFRHQTTTLSRKIIAGGK